MENEEDTPSIMNPHRSSVANLSHQPSDANNDVLDDGEISIEEDESLDNNNNYSKHNLIETNNDDDDDDDNKRKMSLISLVTPSSRDDASTRRTTIDLGHGSEVIYIQRFLPFKKSWALFDYLDKHIPWTRPTIRVFGRSCLQPRDTCYVASSGLTALVYSGYRPHAYSWDDFPPLKEILDSIYETLPGSRFNSLLLNRYKGANDYVGWHADDEKLYGQTPEIASVSFGCERDFVLKKKKKNKESSHEKLGDGEPASKRQKRSNKEDQKSLTLKHGSLLVMRGYTQRDWIHSVPKRVKAEGTRINLTFRLVL